MTYRPNPDARKQLSQARPAPKVSAKRPPAENSIEGDVATARDGWHPGRFLVACEALARVLEFRLPADASLSQYFRANRQLGQRDRAAVADVVYDILRHRRWLEKLSPEVTPRGLLLLALMKLRGFSLSGVALLARPYEMEWLTQARAEDTTSLTPAERFDLPDWLYNRLVLQYGADEIEPIARSLQTGAPLDLRVNTLKTSREEVLATLKQEGIEGHPTPFSPIGIRLAAKPAINQSALFKSGAIEVQDEGSQLITLLVAPRRQDLVIDFCAGAGGKTLALGAAMDSRGRLYAFDVSDRRLFSFRPRLKRSGLSNVFPQRISGTRDSHVKRLAGKADRVLLDVPCSGLGTLRRNPDLKWRVSDTDIAEMVGKQSEILRHASSLVKPKGRLVYATCSLLNEENEGIVEAFLRDNHEFRLINAATVLTQARVSLDTGEYLRLRPDTHGTDGFFAAVIERSAE